MTRTTSGGRLRLPRYARTDPTLRTPVAYAEYKSTGLRAPLRTPVDLPHRLTEVTGPLLGEDRVQPGDADLSKRDGGEAQGQRIVVSGRVLDSDGRPVPHTLVEIWQANAGGRYRHVVDDWPAPLDPHFDGLGRVMTDEQGNYEFTTIKPGAYPWGNHHNAWRPAHIHFSLFGRAFTQRLVTQMYFPDDPLSSRTPSSMPSPRAPGTWPSAGSTTSARCPTGRWASGGTSCCEGRSRRRSRPRTTGTSRDDGRGSIAASAGERGAGRDRNRARRHGLMPSLDTTPSATVGPYLAIGLTWAGGELVVPPDTPGAIWLRGTVVDGNGDPIPDAMVETWQADPDGRFDHPNDPRGATRYPGFTGFGRSHTDGAEYAICTLKPGRVPDAEAGLQAPHVDVSVFARGLLDRVVTRIYFADEATANAEDDVLRGLPEDRRATLLATPTEVGYRLDLHLQGDGETVFFAV